MPIPLELLVLINRLNQELDQIQQDVQQGLQPLRSILDRFPNNVVLIQLFAGLNSLQMFASIYRSRTQRIATRLDATEVGAQEIQEAGEELGDMR